MPGVAPRKGGLLGARGELLVVFELAALVALALTQPVLGRFGKAPDVFAFEGAQRGDVILFALAFTLVPLAVLWTVEVAVGLVSLRARRVVHLILVATAAFLVTMDAAAQLDVADGAFLAVVGIAVAGLAVLACAQTHVAASFLRAAAVALPAFLVLFLFVAPVSELVTAGSVQVGGRARAESSPPIVVLLLDELPLASLVDTRGQIDEERLPGFARLAALSTWYRNATAVSAQTWYAVPSALSGRLPSEHALPLASDWPDNLFTVLGGEYRYEVREAITNLCPIERCGRHEGGGMRALLRRAAELYRDVASPASTAVDPQATFADQVEVDLDAFGRNQPRLMTDFLAAMRPGEPPSVHYLHVLLPHGPWRLLPSGLSYPHPFGPPGLGDDEEWTAASPWPALQARQRHLLQVSYTDGLVDDMLDRLEETGLLDEALLVVMADHGVAFRPGEPIKGSRKKTIDGVERILPELAWVPLFVRYPGGADAGEVDDRNALLVDVLPTIADVVGLDLDRASEAPLDGRSLRGPPRETAEKPWQQAYLGRLFDTLLGERGAIPGADSADVFALGSTPGSVPADLRAFAIGPGAHLIGEQVSDLDVGDPTTGVETGAGLDALRAVDRRSGQLPVLVSGTVSGDPVEGAAIAIAVNGRIAAVSPIFPGEDGELAFVGLVPEAWLRDGANDARLFLVPDPAGRRIHPLPP